MSDQDEVTSLDLTSDKFKYIYTNPAVDGKVVGWRVPGVGNDVQSFNGNNTDVECMKLIGIARNTYYKYKRELNC